MKRVGFLVALVVTCLGSYGVSAQYDPVLMCLWNSDGYYEGPFETVEWDFHGQQSLFDYPHPIGDVIRANADGTCPSAHVGEGAFIEQPDYEWIDSSQGLVWESYAFCGLMAGPPGPYQVADPSLEWDYIQRVRYHPCPEGIYQLVWNEKWTEGSDEPQWHVVQVDAQELPAPALSEMSTP